MLNIRTRVKAAILAFIHPKPIPLMRPVSLGCPTGSEGSLLVGRNALITGAGQNIGRNIALEMAKQGANVYYTDVDATRVGSLGEELKKFKIQSKGFVSDVSKFEEIDSLCRSLCQENIPIDILVNNVGVLIGPYKVTSVEMDIWRKTFDTNVTGPLYLTRQIVAEMTERKLLGSVIFISSIHQWLLHRDISYSASKAALGMVINELAIDLAPYAIRVNGIAPGSVAEEVDSMQRYDKYIPLYNTPINPAYIGRAAVYLASEHYSAYTTGSVLTVDSGLSLYNHFVDRRPPGI